jgi:hypothetical protein
MAFKCNKCGSVFEEKQRLEIHRQVHGRKSKIGEYGSPEFNQDRLRARSTGHLSRTSGKFNPITS